VARGIIRGTYFHFNFALIYREEIKAQAEPYEEELKLISTLIQYCLRFDAAAAAVGASVTEESAAFAGDGSAQVITSSNGLLTVPGASGQPRRGSHESGLQRRGNKGHGGHSTAP